MKIPNPGGAEAIALGCLCPILDNGYGLKPTFPDWVFNLDCPLHGKPQKKERTEALWEATTKQAGEHEDPNWNEVYHKPVWATVWASSSVSNEPEINAPIVCLICGKPKGN